MNVQLTFKAMRSYPAWHSWLLRRCIVRIYESVTCKHSVDLPTCNRTVAMAIATVLLTASLIVSFAFKGSENFRCFEIFHIIASFRLMAWLFLVVIVTRVTNSGISSAFDIFISTWCSPTPLAGWTTLPGDSQILWFQKRVRYENFETVMTVNKITISV